MVLQRAACVALAAALVSCGGQHPPAALAVPPPRSDLVRARENAQLLANVLRLQQLLGQAQSASRQLGAFENLKIVGMDEGAVPDFDLLAPGGARYSSKAMVGQEPFVTAFFATWCEYCEVELTALQRAMAKTGPVQIIPVAVDGPDTWPQVPRYLSALGIHDTAVRASDYPRFAAAYDPFDTVPLLVIVGRHGGLVDCVVGYDPADAQRLTAALQLAQSVPADAHPEASAKSSL